MLTINLPELQGTVHEMAAVENPTSVLLIVSELDLHGPLAWLEGALPSKDPTRSARSARITTTFGRALRLRFTRLETAMLFDSSGAAERKRRRLLLWLNGVVVEGNPMED